MSIDLRNKNFVCQILTEFLEVALHNIVKNKRIYPESIFEKRYKYGAIVYQIIHPQLKEYISNCMQAVYILAKNGNLNKFVICFLECINKSFQIVEKVTFEIALLKFKLEKDPFLLGIEQIFRSFYMKVHMFTEFLSKPTENTTFSLQIYTIESCGIQFMDNPQFQKFPWVQVNESYGEVHEAEIVPLEIIENSCFNIQIFIEKF